MQPRNGVGEETMGHIRPCTKITGGNTSGKNVGVGLLALNWVSRGRRGEDLCNEGSESCVREEEYSLDWDFFPERAGGKCPSQKKSFSTRG